MEICTKYFEIVRTCDTISVSIFVQIVEVCYDFRV